MTGSPRQLLVGNPPAKRWLVLALGARVLADATLLAWILLLASAIDRVFLDGADLSAVGLTLAAMGGLLAFRAACLWGAEVTAQRSADDLRRRLRRDLAGAITARGPRGMQVDRVGMVTGTLTEGVESLGTWVTAYVPAAASAVAVPAMVLILVLALDAPTTLILLFTGPMLVLLLAVIGRHTAELTRRRFDELGWLRGFYLDMIRGLGTLKAFGRSADGAQAVEDTSRRFGDTTMEVLRTAFQTSLVMEWAATAATALVAIEVSFRLIGGSLSFGTALAVLILTPEFFVPFRRLAMEYHAGQSGDAAATAVAELLASVPSPPAVTEDTEGSPAAAAGITGTGLSEPDRAIVPPDIEFIGVEFTYPESDRPALAQLDLRLGAGETVALVGQSGAGKSTVAALVLRLCEPSSGNITIDGRDLCDLDARTWRRRVAWVPQEPTIFSGTVADNISLGEPHASRDEIEAAAHAAGAADFIAALPGSYGAHLGEGGTTLSGGERQRLAIARAFLRDAPLVVLDEFTAHLDPTTESEVLDAATRLLERRTALVIAHRVSTARSADSIAVLASGRVVETGTDEALSAAGGRWSELSAELIGSDP